jgi:tetratricopeptide (TPR) repeat protein
VAAICLLIGVCGQSADALALDAGVAASVAAPEVQPLPEFVEPALQKSTAEQLARLDGLIDRLLLPEATARQLALEALRNVDASWLPALDERFESLARGVNELALKALLDRIVAHAREQAEADGSHATTSAGGGKSPAAKRGLAASRPPPGDSLERVVAHPDRSSSFLRPLTEVLAYGRMFEVIGTLPAVRRLLSIYLRFGEFLRVDTELALTRLGDASVAALVETTGHASPRIAEWAKKRLEVMGKLIASDAVQVDSPILRADILRAYGKIRDVETARLLVAFAASERALVRLAARQAVAMLGELASVSLRDAYHKTAGRRAPSEWSWQRVAEQLFAEFDRQRLSDLYRLFNQGREASERGDLATARQLFDQILAWDPMFERGSAMAPVYIAFAESQADTDPEAATLALRRAERLAPDGAVHDRALSLRYTLDARALRARGIIDEVLIQRARGLDPANARAVALEEELLAQARGDRTTFQRIIAAAVILSLALVALGVMALRRRE